MDIIRDLDRQLCCIRRKLRTILLNLARLTGSGSSTGCDKIHHKDEDGACTEEVFGKMDGETNVIITFTETRDKPGTDQSTTNINESTDVITSSSFESSKASANCDVTGRTHEEGESDDVSVRANSDSNLRIDIVAIESSCSGSDDESDESDEDNTEEVEYTDDNENIVDEGYEMPARKPLKIIPTQRTYRVQGDLRTMVLVTEARKRLWDMSEI